MGNRAFIFRATQTIHARGATCYKENIASPLVIIFILEAVVGVAYSPPYDQTNDTGKLQLRLKIHFSIQQIHFKILV